MRAAIKEPGRKELVIADDVEIAAPGPSQVRVDVAHCGLCHSDLSIVNEQFPVSGPVVLGHEASGVVTEVGAAVRSVVPGDKVLLSPIASCGLCFWCVRGEMTLCESGTIMMAANMFVDGSTGLSRGGEVVQRGVGVGGFAEQVLAEESGVVRLDPDVPLDVVSVIGCAVQTGVGAVLNTARVEEGSTVLVMGLGGIGISIVQGARLAGARRIIVSDPVAQRRDGAEHFGATDAIDPTTQDVVGAAQALTGGRGVDYAFDAVGSAALVTTGVMAIRNGGTMVMVGAGPLEETLGALSPLSLMIGEKKLIGSVLGSVNSHRDIPRFVELWRAGRLDLESMVTTRRPLDEIDSAVADMEAGRGLRTMLDIA